MKRICFFSIFTFFVGISWSQDMLVSKRDISVTIVNEKGRPMKKVKVSSHTDQQSGMTDQSGKFDFKNMTDESTINVELPGVGKTSIPVVGMDTIFVKRQSSNSYSYIDINAKSVMVEKINKKSSSVLDVPSILEKRQFNSLMELLQAYGGIFISPDGKASVRGVSTFDSTNKGGSASNNFAIGMGEDAPPRQTYELMVFIDGIQAGTLKEVNYILNVRDIQSIEVNKSGSGYGLQGANGVILITTKRNVIE